MTHQQIIDKLAAGKLVQSIDEDLIRLIEEFVSAKNKSTTEKTEIIISKLLPRWNCVLGNNSENISMQYKQKTYLVLAVLLHKYGFQYAPLTTNALKAIDQLNEEVVLNDDFFRKSEDIKAFLKTEPIALKRKPARPENITFYREKDVVSIQIGEHYYGAYITELTASNEIPVIEFYDKIFDKIPDMEELSQRKAKGVVANDGKEYISKYAVAGMKFLPDFANQIHLISASEKEPPSEKHLQKSIGLYAYTDLLELPSITKRLFV